MLYKINYLDPITKFTHPQVCWLGLLPQPYLHHSFHFSHILHYAFVFEWVNTLGWQEWQKNCNTIHQGSLSFPRKIPWLSFTQSEISLWPILSYTQIKLCLSKSYMVSSCLYLASSSSSLYASPSISSHLSFSLASSSYLVFLYSSLGANFISISTASSSHLSALGISVNIF